MKRKQNMVYTPEHHIPIGEVVKIGNEYGLRIKKSKGSETEVVSIGQLVRTIVKKGDESA